MIVKYLNLAAISATTTVVAGPIVFGVDEWLDLFLHLAAIAAMLHLIIEFARYGRGGPRPSIMRSVLCVLGLVVLIRTDFKLNAAWENNSEQMIQVAIAFVFAYFLVRLLIWLSRPIGEELDALLMGLLERIEFGPYSKTVQKDPLVRVSPEVQKRASIHEAGHVLACALLPEVGQLSISARIVSEVNMQHPGQSLGRVSYCHCLKDNEASSQRWEMLSVLAGQEAERECLGEYCSGGAEDLMKWYRYALPYLASGFEAVTYFPEPTTAWQRETNELALSELMRRQRQELRAFFALNHNLLVELSDQLVQVKCMGQDELKIFIEKAIQA
ncbi:MAG: hypothetical protein AAF329_20580 [Cyanobacteria bacterium P01_A01_bin.17]